MRARWLPLVLLLACSKVPFIDVNAAFSLAEAAWFQDEATLFIFYEVQAEQGLSGDTVMELSYRTDDEVVDWTPLSELATVHQHLAVDCGPFSRCGSTSVRVAKAPSAIKLRLRYHPLGALSLGAPLHVNFVRSGAPWSNRSLVVYGVFDAANTRVQWRARHQFPAVRNEEAQRLGLRRLFSVAQQSYGTLPSDTDLTANVYGYGFAGVCPADFSPLLGADPAPTRQRAIFAPDDLALAAAAAPVVCALATVTDAGGTFVAPALARKNPRVRAAFPALRSPIQEAKLVRMLLAPCHRTVSDVHLAMQRQRLGITGSPDLCLDEVSVANLATAFATLLQARVDEERNTGHDMILLLALHHDETTGALSNAVQAGLGQVLPAESQKSSPRLAGAMVFDSYGGDVGRDDIRNLVIWCPARSASAADPKTPHNCAIAPDSLNITLGYFTFATLPILPSRQKYLDYVAKYSVANAGQVQSLTCRVPGRTPLSDDVPIGQYGVATFFNGESVTAAATDAFSYCAANDKVPAVYRLSTNPQPQPLAALPDAHALNPQPAYALGLVWDFPFLVRLQYQNVFAGAGTAFSVTIPFGIASDATTYEGASLWQQDTFALAEVLLQCDRFCDHPTFDSAGVYNPQVSFAASYRDRCYRPLFPGVGEGGFPRDP